MFRLGNNGDLEIFSFIQCNGLISIKQFHQRFLTYSFVYFTNVANAVSDENLNDNTSEMIMMGVF